MKVLSRSIRLFALVLFFGATGAPVAISKERASDKVDVDLANRLARERGIMGGEVPYGALNLARRYFEGRGSLKDKKLVENWLRIGVLHLTEEDLEKNRTFMSENGWDAGLRKEFEKAVSWKNSLRELTPDDAYRLAQTYFESAEEQQNWEKKEGYKVLAQSILVLAAVSGHSQARFDISQIYLSGKAASWPQAGRGALRHVAHEDDYAPAQVDLANRYLEGRGFTQNDVKAYYWLLRAQVNGAGVEDRIRNLAGKLSPAERQRAAEWITDKEAPDP